MASSLPFDVDSDSKCSMDGASDYSVDDSATDGDSEYSTDDDDSDSSTQSEGEHSVQSVPDAFFDELYCPVYSMFQ